MSRHPWIVGAGKQVGPRDVESEPRVGDILWRGHQRCLVTGLGIEGPYLARDFTRGDHDLEKVGTSRIDSEKLRRWRENYHRNKPSIRDGLPRLIREWKGRNLVLVGNGPSLDKNIETLGQFRALKNTTVCGVNRLLLWTREMDYLAIMDSAADPAWWGAHPPGHVTAIASIYAPPEVKGFKNIIWFSHLSKPAEFARELAEEEKRLGGVDPGGHVTHAVIHMAWRAQVRRLVLLGMDYAFSRGYKYHRERLSAKNLPCDPRILRVIPDLENLVSLSFVGLERQRLGVEFVLDAMRRHGMDVINASEGGNLGAGRRLRAVEVIDLIYQENKNVETRHTEAR